MLTLTRQFAVVIHTHSGVQVALAPRQRRDKEFSVSQVGLSNLATRGHVELSNHAAFLCSPEMSGDLQAYP